MGSNTRVIDIKTVFGGLKIAILLSLLISAILILMTLDVDSFGKAVESINPGILLSILALLLINWFAAGLGFKIMTTTVRENITIFEGVIIYLAGSFIS